MGTRTSLCDKEPKDTGSRFPTRSGAILADRIPTFREVELTKSTTLLTAAVASLCATSIVAFAASDFEGKWQVKDTSGKPFEITLSADGGAKASGSQSMSGTWKEDGGAAVISWKSGWTTKISKENDHYVKAAYRKGQSLSDPPANTSPAEKAD